jgi:hypothetical protein
VPKIHERNRFYELGSPGVGTLTETPEMFPGPVTEFVRKTANETVNNSASFQDDDELFFPVRANEIWDVEASIRYDSSTTADIKWRFTVPGSGVAGTGSGLIHRLTGGASGLADDVVEPMSDLTRTPSGGIGIGTEAPMHIRMLIVVGDTDGNIVYQWAQNTAALSNTSVRNGSWIIGRKVG